MHWSTQTLHVSENWSLRDFCVGSNQEIVLPEAWSPNPCEPLVIQFPCIFELQDVTSKFIGWFMVVESGCGLLWLIVLVLQVLLFDNSRRIFICLTVFKI